jgi:hypothetical protein
VTEGKTDRVIFLPITFTNREAEQRMSLDFELFGMRAVGTQVLGPVSIWPYNRVSTRDTITSPLAVEPQTRRDGYLQFAGEGALVVEFDEQEDGSDVWAKADFQIFLRVIDHISGGAIEEEVKARPKPTKSDSERS